MVFFLIFSKVTGSWLTADLITAVTDRNTMTFSTSWATQAVKLNTYKAFDRVRHANIMEFQVRLPALSFHLSVIEYFEWF